MQQHITTDEPFTLQVTVDRRGEGKGNALSVPPDARQRMLFSGLDCLPGQMDLFETDGELEDARSPGNVV